MGRLGITLLGRFEVRDDGRAVIDDAWRPAKAAAIVKMLALQPGHALHRDQLIDRLWPEADAAAGESSFYKNVHHLRAAMRTAGAPDLIALNRGMVALHTDADIDADAFRELARQALEARETSMLDQALAACGGDLLPGDLYEDWAIAPRDELARLRQRVRLALGDRHLQRGRIDDAIRHFGDVLASDPVSEEAHRGLMRAYGASGQRELALQQYDRCCNALAGELGAEPSAETMALAGELRRVGRLRSAVEEAIEAPVRAAEAAERRRAWDEAIAQYRMAIDALHATDEDDEREAELLLRLAAVSTAVSADPAIAEMRRRAAELAERAGAFELMARALVAYQDAADALPANHAGHHEAAELIAAAIERCPPGADASRALLLAAGARGRSAASRTENEQHVTGRLSIAGGPQSAIESQLREAVAIARRVGKVDVLAYTLTRLRTYITSPDTLEERLALTEEMLGLVANTRHEVSEYEARLFRHEDLLESGDLDGARIQGRAMLRLGEAMQTEGIVLVAKSLLATHAIADGPLSEGKRLLFESRAADARRGDNSNSQFRFGIQLLALRWHEGRIGEMYEGYRRTVDVLPRMDGARAALALICSESERIDETRAELSVLASKPVSAIPRDYLWWQTLIGMTYAAIATDARDVAAQLYEAMLPYAARNAPMTGAVSFGSAELYLAMLAQLLGRADDAAAHYERALAFNIRTRQRVWIARTRLAYAGLLDQRDGAGDTARAADLRRIAHDDAREAGMALPE